MKKMLFTLLCATVTLFAADGWPRQGTVTGKELTIRAQPGVHFESLGNFRRGETVTIVGQKDNWFEVQLPDRIEAWVAADAIDENGEILQDKCPLYAGPGIMFANFAQVPRGTKLQLVASEIAKWRLVKVPPTATAWVNSAFVQLDEPQEPEPPQPDPAEEAEARRQEAEAKLEEAQNAAKAAQEKQQEAEKALEASLAKLAAVEEAAKVAEQKRQEAEQLLKENTEKADAAARAAELAILKQNEITTENKNAEVQQAQNALNDLKKQIEELHAQMEENQKNADGKVAEAEASLKKLQEEIDAKKAERQRFEGPEVFEGVVVGLGVKATSSASHILYNAENKPVCFLFSNRIPLNQWLNMRVKLSGNIQQPEGWKMPLVHVTDIIIQ